MKKLICSMLLSFSMLISPVLAQELEGEEIVEQDGLYGECGENVVYSLDEEGVLTLSGTGSVYNYSSSSMPWFPYKDEILSLVVEEGVTSIGDYAFYKCNNLESVVLKSVINIGNYSFFRCPKLSFVDLGIVNTIGNSAFYMSSISDVTFPETLKSLGKYAFGYCKQLTSISCDPAMEHIGQYAFTDCTSLQEFIFPKEISEWEQGVLMNCTSLAYVELPKYFIELPMFTFFGNSSLDQITLPNCVQKIGRQAFQGCTNLEVYYLGNEEELIVDSTNTIPIHYLSAQIDGYSLSLAGDIALHVYEYSSEDVSLLVTLPNGKKLELVKDEDSRFTCHISAKDMTGMIHLQIQYPNGILGQEYDYSIEEYGKYLINHYEEDSREVQVVKAMLTYGRCAQLYFDYKLDHLPSVFNEIKAVDLSNYDYMEVDNNSDIEFIGARLVLTSKPALMLYYKGSTDFEVDHNTMQIREENPYTVITITNIDDMSKDYVVQAEDYKLSYNMFSYGNHALKLNNQKLSNLIYSMYAYNALFK